MSATRSLDATVESLCGDLSRIRAPRGTELNARSWSTEAPLRMLLNNLDAEVAERPQELVVYGGSGKAAHWDSVQTSTCLDSWGWFREWCTVFCRLTPTVS